MLNESQAPAQAIFELCCSPETMIAFHKVDAFHQVTLREMPRGGAHTSIRTCLRRTGSARQAGSAPALCGSRPPWLAPRG